MADSQKGHGQGQVTDPAHDGRLKENGGGQQQAADAPREARRMTGVQVARDGDGRGQVKDPAHDGRLKQNR